MLAALARQQSTRVILALSVLTTQYLTKTKWLKTAKLVQVRTSKTLAAVTFINIWGGFTSVSVLVKV